MSRTLVRRLGTVLLAGVTAAATALSPASAYAAGTYSLLIFPDQGQGAVYSFINSATRSIDMTMYELRDTTAVNDLVSREKAGVTVRVILDAANTSVNASAYSTLRAGGVGVTYSSSAFVYTHQKTITVDGTRSLVMTGNLDSTYYSTSRDYAVFDPDAADVAAIERVFNADYAKTSITPTDGDNLVWSPTDSQTRLLSVITGAQHTLDVEQLEFSDTALVNAIVADARRGVRVRVVVEDPSSYTTQLNQVTAAGGTVTSYSSSTGFYVHAKAIVADYGTATAKVFAGSENFSDNSLNHNRELGIILNDSAVLNGVEATFNADFAKTPVTISNPGNQTGRVGSAASLQIQAGDSSGRTLTYRATGLPAGLTIGASTGLISGTPTTATTATVTVTATDGSASASTTFTWTIASTGGGGGGGGCSSAQLLGNPGFETGTASPWTASSGVISNRSNEAPHAGSWYGWLDGYGTTTTNTLSQTVTLPAGCASYQLGFWLHIDTAETTTTAYDTLTVQVLNGSGTVLGTLATYSNANHNTGYAQRVFDLSAYAGQAVTLRFTGSEDYTKQTSFVIDDTALNVS
ncbi:hypothetical protein GCM10023322_80990 [Rugosimonospora acidiphila]|uniref:phospholipase D n=1 Tax=Rugosimonospora acidiphila TaxID=556531 RepID=A0ABP9SRD0_9ACTN